MTLNTRLHIAKPVAAERLFLHVLAILESDPLFVPSWERPADEPFRSTPGPLRLGRATYKHERKGEPLFRGDGTPWCHATTGEQFKAKQSEFASTLGQGLGAILEVTYGSDGPLTWPHEEGETCDGPDCCPDHGNTADPYPQHYVSANFDTSYGYKLPNGAGCSDLHAFLLLEIGTWLAGEGVDEWSWHDEFRGTWHLPVEVGTFGNAALAAEHFGRVLA